MAKNTLGSKPSVSDSLEIVCSGLSERRNATVHYKSANSTEKDYMATRPPHQLRVLKVHHRHSNIMSQC